MKRHIVDVAVVDPSTLIGEDLRAVLKERSFPARSIRLYHSQSGSDGLLAEDDGEATYVPPLPLNVFSENQIVFLCGETTATAKVLARDDFGKCIVIDLAGTRKNGALVIKSQPLPKGNIFLLPHPVASTIAEVSGALSTLAPVEHMVVAVDRPASDIGKKALDELFAQAIAIASFKPVPKTLLGAQSAFNFFCPQDAVAWEQAVREDCTRLTKVPVSLMPARAGVFHGHLFRMLVWFQGKAPRATEVLRVFSARGSGFDVRDPEDLPGTIDAVGNDEILVLKVTEEHTWLKLDLAADLLRRPLALRAVEIAEQVLLERGLLADA